MLEVMCRVMLFYAAHGKLSNAFAQNISGALHLEVTLHRASLRPQTAMHPKADAAQFFF